jgi:anti-sigma factor RsiW
MESCARVAVLLPEFVEGEIPLDESGRIGGHLRVCGACRRRAAGHQRTLEALDSLPQVVPPSDLRLLVMRQVRSNPLPVAGRTARHLRLVKSLFWAAFIGMASLTSGAGAILLARASLGRTSLADPTLLTDWLITLGQLAFSLVLSVATRAEVPSLLSTPRSIASWGSASGWILVLGVTCIPITFGILATARAVFRPRSR